MRGALPGHQLRWPHQSRGVDAALLRPAWRFGPASFRRFSSRGSATGSHPRGCAACCVTSWARWPATADCPAKRCGKIVRHARDGSGHGPPPLSGIHRRTGVARL